MKYIKKNNFLFNVVENQEYNPLLFNGFDSIFHEDNIEEFINLFSDIEKEYPLFKKKISLLEISSVFSSERIFNYLNFNGYSFGERMELFSFAGNNSRIIKQVIEKSKMSANDLFSKSLRCINMDVASYLIRHFSINQYLFNKNNSVLQMLNLVECPLFDCDISNNALSQDYMNFVTYYFCCGIKKTSTEKIDVQSKEAKSMRRAKVLNDYHDLKVSQTLNHQMITYKTIEQIKHDLECINHIQISSVSDLTELVKSKSFFGIPLYVVKKTDNNRGKQYYQCSFHKITNCMSYVTYYIYDGFVYFIDANWVHNHPFDYDELKNTIM